MTETALEYESNQAHPAATRPAAAPAGLATVPIRQVNTPPGANLGMHFTTILGTGAGYTAVEQLLGGDPLRAEATVIAVDQAIVLAQSKEMAEAAANATQSSLLLYGVKSVYNTTTTPAGNAVLANLGGANILPPGTYQIDAYAYFGGATSPVDGTDNDNIRLFVDAVNATNALPMPAALTTMNHWTFPKIQTASGTISLKALSAATAGVIYRTSLIATLMSMIGLPPSGLYVPAGQQITLRHCDQVWAAATTPVPGRVSVGFGRDTV
jgi:hypothetical protein